MKSLPVFFMNVFFACVLVWASIPQALAEDVTCEQTGAVHIWISPLNPKNGEPVKIMAVSTDGPLAELALTGDQGQRIALQPRRRGGPPWSLVAAWGEPDAGRYRVEASRDGKPVA